mgnify:CR=1 FL=1
MGLFKKNDPFYDISKLWNYGCTYSMAFGQKGNGKTYQGLKKILELYTSTWDTGKRTGVYMRRNGVDFVQGRAERITAGLVRDHLPEKMTDGYYTDIYYKGKRYYLCRYEENKKGEQERICDEKPFLYAFDLTSSVHDSSGDFPDVGIIHFDEFMSRTGYLKDEWETFRIAESTIIRDKQDVRILMTGNTLNLYNCPYFDEMGLTRIPEQKQGTIDLYTYGDSDTSVAVEYTGHRKTEAANKYFAFGRKDVDMVTKGSWDIRMYPHLPIDTRIRPKDIIMSFYIEYKDILLQGDIIVKDDDSYIYIHPKTTPLQRNVGDIIYSTSGIIVGNIVPSWIYGVRPIDKLITKYFNTGKVCYSSNSVGEIVMGFLDWSNRNRQQQRSR